MNVLEFARAFPWQLGRYNDPLSFIRKNLLRLLFWPVLAIVIAAVGWSFLLKSLDEQKAHAEADALNDAAILARAYATHLYRSLESIDHITWYVKTGWEQSQGRFRLEDDEKVKTFPVNSGFYVSLTDELGNLVTSNIPGVQRVNVSREPYFLAHQNISNLFHIDMARIGNFSNRPVIPFSRRLEDQNGDFQGIVLVSVLPNNFISGYDQVTLKKHGFLGVVGTDGTPRLSRIGDEVYLPGHESIVQIPIFENSHGSMLLDGKDWFADKRARYVGWQETQGYGMIAMAGLDQEDALAAYWAERKQAVFYATLLSIALALFTLYATYLWMRLAWRKKQFDAMQSTYRAATESANEGFYILSPVIGPSLPIADFKITDCNEHGARFFGHTRQDLIGRKISELNAVKPARRSMHVLCKAMKKGQFNGEIHLKKHGIVGPEWVDVRIVRHDKNLALTLRDITSMKAHVDALEKRGNEDVLTGLPNRFWVNAYLPDAIGLAAAKKTMVSLLFIDLDGFKAVNDTMGHDAGDQVLRNAGRRLKEAVRPNDYVARLGGDEFLVILEDIHNEQEVSHIAERILEIFHAPFHMNQGTHNVGASIGISMFPKDGADANTLLKNADLAMYAVKAAGKRNYRFFDQSYYEQMRSRYQKEAELKHALEHNQLIMHYQPRVNIATGAASSMEALVRWAHPTKGLIEPNDFIPLAQEAGLICRLGEQVIDKVCAQLAYWKKHNEELIPVSINVCPIQFIKSDIVQILISALKKYQIDPSLIEIELTEATMLEHTEETDKAIHSIQKMGIKLLVDDFGTGYSSLSQLQKMDFDVLKVDQSFTSALNQSREGMALFTAIITMAHSLGMRVVAEGVETLEQINTLKSMHCDEVQGFYISRPLPAQDAQSILPTWIFSDI